MRKDLRPAKYSREKILDPRKTHEKKKLGPTIYPRENILEPRNTHEGTMALDQPDPRWHATHQI